MNKKSYVYTLANKRNGTLYVGITSDLIKQVWQHKKDLADGFTKKYSVKKLVYYEVHEDIISAIHREKRLKEWQRKWKQELIEKFNPKWIDLYSKIMS